MYFKPFVRCKSNCIFNGFSLEYCWILNAFKIWLIFGLPFEHHMKCEFSLQYFMSTFILFGAFLLDLKHFSRISNVLKGISCTWKKHEACASLMAFSWNVMEPMHQYLHRKRNRMPWMKSKCGYVSKNHIANTKSNTNGNSIRKISQEKYILE